MAEKILIKNNRPDDCEVEILENNYHKCEIKNIEAILYCWIK